MKIRKGDIVKISKGKDAGKSGKVLSINLESGRLVVEGANLAIKHLRPRRTGEKGQRIQFPAPMNISNVMLMCPSCGRAVRVGRRSSEGEHNDSIAGVIKKMRYCKKCNTAFT